VEPAGSPSAGTGSAADTPSPTPESSEAREPEAHQPEARQPETREPEALAAASGSRSGLALAVTAYVGARVVLVAIITGVLVLAGLPLLLALLVALVVSLPLSLIVFRPLRTRLNREIEAATATRRAQRDRFRAELRGD
jgi:Flp pilus assembly protein TadB